jgi:tetratricopeptide (TPR) repeat protein
MSQLLRRIEERLLTESDSYVLSELKAKRASYLARVGRFQEAKDAIAEVRQVFGDGRSGRVTALLMLAEALTMYYERLASGASDRVARALLLGQAMKDQEIISLASAWKAFLDFEDSKFESAFRSVKTSLDHAEESNHASWTRNCIVLALGFSLCGDSPSSQHWFLKGRHHALEEGDQVSLDALLHNKAVFGVAWLRVQRCLGERVSQQITRARLELSSTRNLQALAGVSAHGSYIDLANARLLMLEQDFPKALDALDRVAVSGPFPTGHFNNSLLALERAYCFASLGQPDQALEVLAVFDEAELLSLDVDDRVVSAWIQCELSNLDSRFGNIDESRSKLAVVSEEQDQLVSRLKSLLDPFVSS